MFLIVFLWTPPHFWALAIKYRDDYAQASVPMMPVVKGFETTRRQMFLYTLTLVPTIACLYIGGVAGLTFLSVSLAATFYFIWTVFRLYRTGDNKFAMPVFHYSCLYLFVIFGALAVDRLIVL